MSTDARETAIRSILGRTRRIAMVGASPSPYRPSHGVMASLLDRGYDVVPVNPNVTEVLGRPAVATLAEVEGPIDLVDVFRRPEHAPGIAQEAVAVGARGLWLQQGVRSEEARRTAEEAGIDYVEDACLAVEVARLAHEFALPPAGRGG